MNQKDTSLCLSCCMHSITIITNIFDISFILLHQIKTGYTNLMPLLVYILGQYVQLPARTQSIQNMIFNKATDN